MIAVGHRARTVAVALAALGLLLGTGTVAAQGVCTIERLAGMYAFESHGSSTFVLGPAPPRHWSLTSAPFVMVGWITLHPDSAMSGKAWVILGRMTSGLTAGPFEGQLTALDETTCTAILEWAGTFVPGTTPGFHRERLVFVDNGREFRSTLIQSPSATMAWIGRGHRIPQASEHAPGCRPHLPSGDLLLQCEALSSVVSSTVSASASMLYRLTVAADGSFTGTSYVKSPTYSEASVEGAFDVQPDCTVEARLLLPSLPDVVHHGRGVIFDEGKSGFLILPLETTVPEGTSVPAFARCDWLSLGR
jgi:hypothetical protein